MPSQPAESSTRLGVVQYLNTKPLVHAFEADQLEHPFELIYDVPSECARKLHAHETDVALIPAIEIARAPEPYSVVRGVGICSVGPVNSVFLVLNKDPEKVLSVALDTSSRSSVALTRILFEKRFGISPRTVGHAPDVDRMLNGADAAVVIGDLALELDRDRYRVLDLGDVWTEWTGLPFVYACWTGRPGSLTSREQDLLVEAKSLGLEQIDVISAEHARGRSFSAEFYGDYLTGSIHFDMGDLELEGLRRFFAYAAELGLIEQAPQITFF
jgi:chorismate dehydratase